jgi:hypothetical protein
MNYLALGFKPAQCHDGGACVCNSLNRQCRDRVLLGLGFDVVDSSGTDYQ